MTKSRVSTKRCAFRGITIIFLTYGLPKHNSVKSSQNISDIMTKTQQSNNYHNVQVNLAYNIKELNAEEHET